MSVRIQWKRAERVFAGLLEDLRLKRGPYATAKVPHDNENFPIVMERGGITEARFLFVVCFYMRGGIKSDMAFKSLGKLFEMSPQLFVGDYSSANDGVRYRQQIETQLPLVGLKNRAYDVSEIWVANMTKIDKFWSGDPRKLIEGTTSFKTLVQRIVSREEGDGRFDQYSSNGFLGFREKMVSMLAYFLMDCGLVEFYQLPVPVDFHVLRVLFSNRLLTCREEQVQADNPQMLAAARRLVDQYCRSNDVSWLKLCDCLWLLSRTYCRKQLGNRSRFGKINGRRTEVFAVEHDWEVGDRVGTYENTCAQCSACETCVFNIPSATYYRKGILHKRGKRPVPPVGTKTRHS